MKIAIVQKGIAKTGKSTTIRFLYEKLIDTHPNATVLWGEPPALKKDFKVVVALGEFRIGFQSAGDPGCNDRMAATLDVFVKFHCDVIVCATRTFGGTVEEVEALENNGYRMIWRERRRVVGDAAQTAENNLEARCIFGQIQEMLSAAAV